MSEMDVMQQMPQQRETGQAPAAQAPPPVEAPAFVSGDEEFAWMEEASPEEQADYARAIQAISKALYETDEVFDGIEGMLQGPDPVDALVRATVTLITEVDKKIQISEVVLPHLPFVVFDMLLEVGTKAGFFDLSERDIKVGMAAAQETLLRAYGVTEEQFEEASRGLNQRDVDQLADVYQEVTNGQGLSK